ncbi:Heterokaryon incompatibility [Lasiodiplodia theobromae]|nr:Heterokaryon incompatibility [Lasiodiplodia theobromae]
MSTFELMALSISVKDLGGVEHALGVQDSRKELERIIKDEAEEITFFDSTGEALLPCPVANVMIIGRRSNGICHRMGIGWIFMRSWAKAERRFETIVLE